MSCPIHVVDSFTSRRFAGNPAGVCLLDSLRDTEWMQSVAAELNLSETAFVRNKGDRFDLRWFTPTTEVELCGHATIAAAHILWEKHILTPGSPAEFETLSGRLSATKNGAWIDLDFPAFAVEPAQLPKHAAQILTVSPTYVGRSRFDYLLELETESEVRLAEPDFAALSQFNSVRGWILTARSDSVEYDFVSRFFAPTVGINEDPVTGSAHCCLSPYWSARLGRADLTGFQASRRSGTVKVSLRGSRVQISGQAVTAISGELF